MSKKQIYEKVFITHGYLTLLYVMKLHEESEKFEECAIIRQVLKELYERNNFKYRPMRYCEEAIIEMRIACMLNFGFSGDIIIDNLPNYAEEVIKQIDSVLI